MLVWPEVELDELSECWASIVVVVPLSSVRVWLTVPFWGSGMFWPFTFSDVFEELAAWLLSGALSGPAADESADDF